MDKVVKVHRDFLNRVRSFLNIFAAKCKGCLRKDYSGCLDCDCLRARTLTEEIDNIRDAKEELYYIDNPIAERHAVILTALRQAKRPLLAKEIKVTGISRMLKWVTLYKMYLRGQIGLVANESKTRNLYYDLSLFPNGINPKQNNKKQNNNEHKQQLPKVRAKAHKQMAGRK